MFKMVNLPILLTNSPKERCNSPLLRSPTQILDFPRVCLLHGVGRAFPNGRRVILLVTYLRSQNCYMLVTFSRTRLLEHLSHHRLCCWPYAARVTMFKSLHVRTGTWLQKELYGKLGTHPVLNTLQELDSRPPLLQSRQSHPSQFSHHRGPMVSARMPHQLLPRNLSRKIRTMMAGAQMPLQSPGQNLKRCSRPTNQPGLTYRPLDQESHM